MRAVLLLAGFALFAGQTLAGQGGDPKRDFTSALGRLTSALEGRFGDDPSRILGSLDALESSLKEWDSALERATSATAEALAKAAPAEAVRLRVALAVALAERGRVDDAVAQLNQAIAAAPRDVDAHTVLALVHTQLTGNTAAAFGALRVAVGADPAAPLQRYLLAKHAADQGSLEEAAAVAAPFRRATRDPNAPDRAPFVRLHLVPEVEGIEPYYPHARYAPAMSLIARADYTAAVAALRTAVAADAFAAPPAAAATALTEAGVALRDGDVAGALTALDRAQQAAPSWSDTRRLRGVALAAGDRFADAQRAFADALRLDPASERTHLALADALAQDGKYEDALAAVQTAASRIPDSARLQHTIGRLEQRVGRYPEAVAAFDRSQKLQPALPLLGMNSLQDTVAQLHRAQQQFSEATRAFAKRVNLVPNSAAAHRDLGDVYVRQGLDDVAWTELAMAEALAPRDVATQVSLAQLHLRSGRLQDAAAAARRALTLDAGHVQARYALGTALVRMDQTDEGTRELETYRKADAAETAERLVRLEAEGLRREATLAAGGGDYAKAVALLTQVVEKEPKSAAAHVELGAALVKAGRAAEAVDRLQIAAGLGATEAVYRHLADAYQAQGQAAEATRAREVYQQIRRDALRAAGRQ